MRGRPEGKIVVSGTRAEPSGSVVDCCRDDIDNICGVNRLSDDEACGVDVVIV